MTNQIINKDNSIKFILYGKDAGTLEEGKSYIVENVRLNSYNNTVYINTTSKWPFSFAETEKMDVVIQNVASEVTVLAKIIGIGAIDMHYTLLLFNV